MIFSDRMPLSLKSIITQGFYYTCLVIIISSVIIRFYYIDRFTYETDESISIIAAHGVAKYGLPHLAGGRLYPRSHLISYSIGSLIKLFGFNPFSIRAVSIISSIILLILIYVVGSNYFDSQTGLIAAFILSISPIQFRYALSARMYGPWELLCFITIITFFYGFIKDNKKYKIITLLFFVLSLFTHRLAVSLLPGFLLFLLYEKRRNIFTDAYLYVCLAVVLAAIYLTFYIIPSPIDTGRLIIIKKGIAKIPKTGVVNLDFRAGFNYLRNSFIYCYPFASIFFLNGIRLKWKKSEGKYLVFMTITTIIINLMLAGNMIGIRLFFNIIPVYILITGVGISGVISYLFNIQSLHNLWLDFKRQLNIKGVIICLLVVFMLSQIYIRLTWRRGIYENLLNAYGIIFRYVPNFSVLEYNVPDQSGAYEYIKQHIRPGDKVASNDPVVCYAYFGGKYCNFDFRQNYITTSEYDPYTGAYRLTNKSKVEKTLNQNHRMWFVFVKIREDTLDLELKDYIIQKSQKVYSTPQKDVEVYLYTSDMTKPSSQ